MPRVWDIAIGLVGMLMYAGLAAAFLYGLKFVMLWSCYEGLAECWQGGM